MLFVLSVVQHIKVFFYQRCFFFGNKRHKRRGTFFERGMRGGQLTLKRTYIESGGGGGGVHKKRTGTGRREGGSKNWKFRANVLFK